MRFSSLATVTSLNQSLPVLSPPHLHTAILFTPSGNLVAHATNTSARSKDQLRVLVGLASEVWLEVGDEGMGMVESEVHSSLCFLVQFLLIAAWTTAGKDSSPAFASEYTSKTIAIRRFDFSLSFHLFNIAEQ